MKRKRIKIKQTKLIKKSINILLCICVLLSIIFGIKHILFNKKEMAHASQENIEVSNIYSNENHPSSDNDIEDIENDNININKNKYKDTNEDMQKSKDDEDENCNKSDHEVNLEHSVFIGDSITEALSYYKFIDSSKVIAHKGYTARKALSDIDKIINLNPDNIFIMLGLNDILIERNVDRYISNYTKLINKLRENLPDTNIYVQSILPVGSQVKSSKLSLSNAQIKEFNDGLKSLASQQNIYYLDVASIINNYNEDFHEPDGIHYKPKFCSIWLEYIKENIQNP